MVHMNEAIESESRQILLSIVKMSTVFGSSGVGLYHVKVPFAGHCLEARNNIFLNVPDHHEVGRRGQGDKAVTTGYGMKPLPPVNQE